MADLTHLRDGSCQLTAAGRQHTWRSGSDSSLLNPDHVQIQLYSGGNTDRVRKQTAQEASPGTEWYRGNEPVSKLRLRYSCPERQPKRRWLRWEKPPCAQPSANCLPHRNHKATEARPGTSTANEHSSYKQQQALLETPAAKRQEPISSSRASSYLSAAPHTRGAGTTRPRASLRTTWRRGTVSGSRGGSPPAQQNNTTGYKSISSA